MWFDLPKNNIDDTCQCQNWNTCLLAHTVHIHAAPGIGEPSSSSPSLSPQRAALYSCLECWVQIKGRMEAPHAFFLACAWSFSFCSGSVRASRGDVLADSELFCRGWHYKAARSGPAIGPTFYPYLIFLTEICGQALRVIDLSFKCSSFPCILMNMPSIIIESASPLGINTPVSTRLSWSSSL